MTRKRAHERARHQCWHVQKLPYPGLSFDSFLFTCSPALTRSEANARFQRPHLLTVLQTRKVIACGRARPFRMHIARVGLPEMAHDGTALVHGNPGGLVDQEREE